MLRIAIKEQNSHFEHGLKIIMTRLANQWQQKIDFLPPEEIDNADIAFLALDDDWFSAGCPDTYAYPTSATGDYL